MSHFANTFANLPKLLIPKLYFEEVKQLVRIMMVICKTKTTIVEGMSSFEFES